MYSLSSSDRILVNNGILTQEGIRAAYQNQSPRLAEYICKILILDPAPRQMFIEAHRGGTTFQNIHEQIKSAVAERHSLLRSLPGQVISRQVSKEHTWQGHEQVWGDLTSDVKKGWLPERINLYETIMSLWNDNNAYAREQLLLVLKHARFLYGAWRAIKKIFKEAEDRYDWEVYATIIERFKTVSNLSSRQSYARITDEDQAQKLEELKVLESWEARQAELSKDLDELLELENASEADQKKIEEIEAQLQAEQESQVDLYEPNLVDWSRIENVNALPYWSKSEIRDVSAETISYLKRRAFRVFRQLASDMPDAFPAAAAEVLIRVDTADIKSKLINTAYDDLWKRQMAPLLKIVEQAKNQSIVQWAYKQLCSHFRLEMKEVPGDWLYRVSQSKHAFTRALAYDYLKNVTGVGMGVYHTKGYHKTVVSFLGLHTEAHSSEAIEHAIQYIRQESVSENSEALCDVLSITDVCALMRHSNSHYRKLGHHLLSGVDKASPYEKYMDLPFFSELIEDPQTFTFAKNEIRKRFTGTDLTATWYEQRVLSDYLEVRQLALDLLQDTTMFSFEDDWTGFCLNILHNLHAEDEIYNEAYRRLLNKDSQGSRLFDDRTKVPVTFLRFLFLHPKSAVYQGAMSLVEEGQISLSDIGIAFLKTIATRRAFKNYYDQPDAWQGSDYVGDYITDGFLFHLKDKKEDAFHSDLGQKVRLWIENEFTLADIGEKWAYERIEWWASDYDFVRNIFRRDVSFESLSRLLPPLTRPQNEQSSDLRIRGAQQVAWLVYHRCHDAGSRKANFYKDLLLNRNERYRAHQGITPIELPTALSMPQAAFDFEWLKRWASSKREPIRDFALKLSRYEMSYWVREGSGIGFEAFYPLFKGFLDVEKYITNTIYSPPEPISHSQINIVELSAFSPEELYRYCFGSDDRPRNFALEVIRRYPKQFGEPQYLLQLSDSKDHAVRQLVIDVLWDLYKAPETTPGWKPFPYSVVPFELSREIDPIRHAGFDPNDPDRHLTPSQVKKTEHYLGAGSPPQSIVKDMSQKDEFDLHAFMRRVLYTLPRDPKRRTEQEKRQGKKKAKALKPSWKNKHTLVSAIRDLALRDKDFAVFVLPVLQEFQAIRGKLLHNACLQALVQIKESHQL